MLVKTLLLGLLLWMGMVGTVGTAGTAVEGIVRPFGGEEEFQPDYNVYSNLATVEERLTEAMSGWPGWTNARVEELGKSVEGRVLRAGVFGKGKKKAIVLAGEHARELIPVEAALGWVEEVKAALVREKRGCMEGVLGEKGVQGLVEAYTVWVIPMLNPDGRKVVEETGNYCWRGNGRGVDLNRNADWEWGGEGSSREEGSEEYCGTSPESEPEVAALMDLVRSMGSDLDMFISLHAGVSQIYIPYADTTSRSTGRVAKNGEEMVRVGREAVAAVDGEWDVGFAADVGGYGADGAIIDYVAGQGVDWVYAVEVWGGEEGQDGGCVTLFCPPNIEVSRVVTNVVRLIQDLMLRVQGSGGRPGRGGVLVRNWDRVVEEGGVGIG